MRKPPKPQGTWRHRILSQTQEAEVNKNALGIKMKHEKKQHSISVKLKQFIAPSYSHYNERSLHLNTNSFLEMATKVRMRTTGTEFTV